MERNRTPSQNVKTWLGLFINPTDSNKDGARTGIRNFAGRLQPTDIRTPDGIAHYSRIQRNGPQRAEDRQLAVLSIVGG